MLQLEQSADMGVELLLRLDKALSGLQLSEEKEALIGLDKAVLIANHLDLSADLADITARRAFYLNRLAGQHSPLDAGFLMTTLLSTKVC